MSEVGALIIKLTAETAQFRSDMGKVKADLAGLGGQARDTGAKMTFSMMESRGAMMLLGEETGVRIPRHLQHLIAEIPGVGAAFAKLLPIVGAAFAVVIIDKFMDKIDKTKDKIATFGAAWATSTTSAVDKTASLDMEILKLRDSTAKLYGKPPQNGPAIAAMEALQKINQLDSGILKAIGDMRKLMTEQDVGLFDQLITGKMGTAGIEDALKPKMQAAQNAFADVINAESQLELDEVNKASAAKIASDKKNIDSKKAVAAASLTAVQSEATAQAALLDTASKLSVVHQTNLHSRIQAKQLTAEQSAAELTRQSAARQMLLSIQQQTTALSTQLGLENSLTGAMKENADAVAAKEQKDKGKGATAEAYNWKKAEDAISEADKAQTKFWDEQKKAVEKSNFDRNIESMKNYVKETQVMLKSGDAMTKSFEKATAEGIRLDKEKAAAKERFLKQEVDLTNGAIAQEIAGGHNLGQAMAHIGQQMMTDAVKYAMEEVETKIGLHTMLESLLKMLHLSTQASNVATTLASTKAQGIAAAGLAGANATASFALAPWPLDMGAPAFGAATMGEAMGMAAFEMGGKIPGSGAVPILGHGGETVVTKALTDKVERAEASGGGGRGMTNHISFAPQIHAVDAAGVDSMLKKHSAIFQRHVTSMLRRVNK